jgi:predicted P-loop ATPase
MTQMRSRDVIAQRISAAFSPIGRGAANTRSSKEFEILEVLSDEPYFKGMFQYNELNGTIDVMRHCIDGSDKCPHPLTDQEVTMVHSFLQSADCYGPSISVIGQLIQSVAHMNPYDPLIDYMKSLPKATGLTVLDRLFGLYFIKNGEVDPATEAAINKALKVWFMQCAERWRYPGSPAEFVIIFVGKTGINKSRFGQALVPRPEWFTSNLPENLKNKDALMLIGSTPLIEMGEMEQLKANQVTTVWNFLSIISDTFRPPYGKNNVSRMRRGVIFGGSNEMEILRSMLGNRRLFPFAVDYIDFKAIERDRDLILSEALFELERCRAEGIEWRVQGDLYDELEEAKRDFMISSPVWDSEIGKFLNSEFNDQRVGDMWFTFDALRGFIMPDERIVAQASMGKEITERLRFMRYKAASKPINGGGQMRLWHKLDSKGQLPSGSVDMKEICNEVPTPF